MLCAESYMGGQSAMPGMAGMGGMTGMGGMPSMQGAGAGGGGAAAQSFMQMQLMQQQNMMALQQMMMSMNMRPQGTEMGSMMGGMPSQMGYPQQQGSVMTGGNPSMMGQQPMMSMPMQVRPGQPPAHPHTHCAVYPRHLLRSRLLTAVPRLPSC